VLVVDDRPENRDILDRLLRLVGFRCSLAEHGEAALEQWRDGHPDLVLMDLRMPVMDGFEAVTQLRAREAEGRLPRTPVIAISASVYDVSSEDLIRRGFDAFLTKPIEEEQLFARLEMYLGVQFQRADAVVESSRTDAGDALAALDTQGSGWKERFLEEVLTGDLEAAEALLGELKDSGLAKTLRQRLKAYTLEEILQHLRFLPGGPGSRRASGESRQDAEEP
jgi:CheY-like chemotaxis protein